MKINRISVAVCPMRVEQVDGAYIMHDRVSGKVIMLNRTASLIWDMIVEHWERNENVDTQDFVVKILKVFDTEALGKDEVQEDVDRVITDFFSAGLLWRV